MRIEGAIDTLRNMNMSEAVIAELLSKQFNVTVEYIRELMLPKAV